MKIIITIKHLQTIRLSLKPYLLQSRKQEVKKETFNEKLKLAQNEII